MNNNTNIWFEEPTKLEKLQRDAGHRYIWGGCYYNNNTNQIDYIYHKRTDKLYGVELQPASQLGFWNVILENERGGHLCVGIIKSDYTKYQELVKGGSFFLEGIQRSMEKIEQEKACIMCLSVDENFNEFFG